jgi:hypothetical protein
MIVAATAVVTLRDTFVHTCSLSYLNLDARQSEPGKYLVDFNILDH